MRIWFFLVLFLFFLSGCSQQSQQSELPCDNDCQKLIQLKRDLETDIEINMQAMQAIESVECNKQTDDRYNLRLTDRQLRERDTLLCNEKRVREVYHGELSRALEEVRNSIANL